MQILYDFLVVVALSDHENTVKMNHAVGATQGANHAPHPDKDAAKNISHM